MIGLLFLTDISLLYVYQSKLFKPYSPRSFSHAFNALFVIASISPIVFLFLSTTSPVITIFAELIFDVDKKPENVQFIVDLLKMYKDTIERILGAKKGSIKLGDENIVKLLTP